MRHHLLIAGTGRAGTSVLVKYLAELGLSTHITVQEQAFWDDDAHAGLEDLILHGGEELPYVVKSPWLHEFVDEVLERDDIAIDGVIIPIRNLTDAASSRSIRELQNVHRAHENMAEERKTWDTWGTTPGGILYSLNPLDQARLLAVGFHHLVERLTRANVPMYLLAFPRLTQDPQYMFRRSRIACLPQLIPMRHSPRIDPSLIRKRSELVRNCLVKLCRRRRGSRRSAILRCGRSTMRRSGVKSQKSGDRWLTFLTDSDLRKLTVRSLNARSKSCSRKYLQSSVKSNISIT